MQSDQPEKRKVIKQKVLIQFGVTAVLLALILRKVDPGKLWDVLQRVSLGSLFLLILVYIFGQMLSAVKWSLLVKNAGIQRKFLDCIKAYLLGMFFNSFGLGTITGDVARAVALKPEKGKRAATFASVIADRIHGLGVLLTIGAISIAIVRPPVLGVTIGRVAAIGALALAIGWFFGPRILVYLGSKSSRFGDTAANIAKAFPTKPTVFLLATSLSLIFHSSQLILHYLIAQALLVEIPLSYIFATIPIANTASALPVSVQGLGVRESAYLFLLTPLGISREVCVAFGALWFLIAQFVSALGALIIAPGLLLGRRSVEEYVPELEIEQTDVPLRHSL